MYIYGIFKHLKIKVMKNIIIYSVLVVLLSSCFDGYLLEVTGIRDRWHGWAHPCADRNCDAEFWIDTLVQPNTWVDKNGYHHIEYRGPKYFTVLAKLDKLHPNYVNNGVPLVACHWDSDTWIAFDTLSFKIPVYNILGLQNGQNDKISVGNLAITITDLAALHPPLNIAGYQFNRATCYTCPSFHVGTSTSYSYNSKQQFYLNRRMVGDTVKIFAGAYFNIDYGPSEEVHKEFDVIIDDYYKID